MDYIFIDTSVFEENNFLEGTRINELLRLAEEDYIKIILPEITYDEILNRTRKNINEALLRFNKYRNDTRILRNINSLNGRFDEINEVKCIEEIEEKIRQKFIKAKIEIIAYSSINIKEIFKSYYKKKPPFGEGIKKEEFPDAFALTTIEEWCKSKKRKCLIFAKDNDIVHYESTNVTYVDYQVYLDNMLKSIEAEDKERKERLDKISELFIEYKSDFEEQIVDWMETQLDDDSIYSHHTNYLYIHDINILETEVELNDYQITSVSDVKISLECNAFISYKVEITYDDENFAMYDDEDKTWHYYDTVTDTITNSDIIKVDLAYNIPAAGEEFAGLEIEGINNRKKIKV